VHAIKVLGQDATYVTLNKANPNPLRGNCNYCHQNATFFNKLKSDPKAGSYTGPNPIFGHTSSATCAQCHLDVNPADLHNLTLDMLPPVTFNCQACHTTYADKYGAPNLTGTNMLKGNCNPCHGSDITTIMDTQAKHIVDRTYAGTPGTTDTVYLNNQASIIVTKGSQVNITSGINDYYILGTTASRVGGAEYYIDVDPGKGKGIPMAAADGYFNAVNGAFENVVATLNTGSLSDGTHKIYVRGKDIGKQWSTTKNATLIVESYGYINGTVTNASLAIQGVTVSIPGTSNITDQDGKYSLRVLPTTHIVNATKLPEYYDYTVSGIVVTADNTTLLDIDITKRPTGTITGSVTAV
jgi:hypothetical protein